MVTWSWRTGIALASAGVLALGAPPLGAQEEGEEEPEDERCVCVGGADVREIRRGADRMRRGMLAAMGNRARLGIVLRDTEAEDAPADGVLVDAVVNDGPADEAGLREDDVVVGLDGRRLDRPLSDAEEEDDLDDDRHLPSQRLISLLADYEPGDEVEVTFRRDGTERNATVELGAVGERWAFVGAPRPPRAPRMRALREMRRHHAPDRPRVFEFREGRPGTPPAPRVRGMMSGERGPFRWMEECGDVAGEGVLPRGGCVAGMEVRSMNEGLGDYFGTDRGALVLDVSDQAELGVEAGDVILEVDGRSVEDRRDLHRILRSYEEGEEVELRIRRRGQERTVRGTVP